MQFPGCLRNIEGATLVRPVHTCVKPNNKACYCQILARQTEISQKNEQTYQPITLLIFSGLRVTKTRVYQYIKIEL